MKNLFRFSVLLVLFVLLGGCGFWSKSDEVKPSPLPDIVSENRVNVLWTANVGDGPGRRFHEMTVSIDGDRIFAADHKGLVASFDRRTGQRIWSVNLKDPIVGGVGAGHGHVIVNLRSGEIVSLSAENGTELWRYQLTSEATAQVQINPSIVVVQTVNGRITALDRVSGTHRWTYDAQVPSLSLRGTGAPLLTSDVTIAGFSNGKLVALNNESGLFFWETRIADGSGRSELERMADIKGRPLILNNTLYVAAYQGQIRSINPFNLQTFWGHDVSTYRSLATGFGNIYLVNDRDAVLAMDAASGASVWTQRDLSLRRLSAPAVIGNAVVVGDAEGYLHFMSQVDGRFVARHRLDSSGVTGDMLVRDNVLYVLTNAGRLAAIQLN
ncbi:MULTISPECIES: outer membrane protein assembly factor BamB [Nitrincola]|uniref:Outer membrane protein assembly factor BamB n=1 Tax=Nitrincola nitratireducens TaxID=1229521 RepID=W9UYT0_9GAMM|nr:MULTISPECIES: outer membrane protein assembly factor BamB [Nitrincola]EXJ09067.1 Lipoprotein yfgL precursor [Nitrincola nitratireducens]